MQLRLAILDLTDPPANPTPTNPPTTPWRQIDEAARMVALEVLPGSSPKCSPRKKRWRCPMNERGKITASHLSRQAIVYLRQSSPAQVEHNRESTERQYALATKARELGWPEDRIVIIDEDLGLSGSGSVARSGFARLTAEVALARVGLVLGLEVSRLARNNADWYRLIDLAGLTDTLIGDADGIYHPALFNDRLLLGLKAL
jgi:hypothetical protein